MNLNDASRIIDVIDQRVRRWTSSMARVETTWGAVAAVASDGRTADLYLYDQSGADTSDNFRLPNGLSVNVGDSVKAAIDKDRGDRWIEEVHPSTTYNKIEFDIVNGEVRLGSGSAATDVTVRRGAASVLETDAALVQGLFSGVYIACNQSSGALADGASYTLSMTSEPAGSRDPFAMHDNSTNPTHLTVVDALSDGLYRFSAFCDLGNVASSAGPVGLRLLKNGAEVAQDEVSINTSDAFRASRSWLVDLVVDDYIEFKVQNDTGVTRTITVKYVALEKVCD